MRLPEYRLRTISVRVPVQYVEWLDELVERGLYKSRGEAVREAIRRLVREELWGCAYALGADSYSTSTLWASRIGASTVASRASQV